MKLKLITIALLALGVSFSAHAHRFWILPAATVLSGEDPWVTFDAAVSNDVFFFNHFPLRPDNITATAPDGTEVELQNPHVGKHRSVFDLQLTQEGTYRIGGASEGLVATWTNEDGERRRWPGRGETANPEDFDTAVPKQADNLKVVYGTRRNETYVTAGAPTETVFAPSNSGLELQPISHPNDLYNGETARFRFLFEGEPAAGTKVTVVPDGIRYRDAQDDFSVEADADGIVAIDWPGAGRYWLEAEYGDDKVAPPATTRQGSYVLTLEVLPQ